MSDHIVFFVLMIIFGGISFFWGFSRLRKKRLIQNIPTSTVRGLALGLVELTGNARKLNKFLKSPIRNETCLFYKYSVERYERRGKSSSWATVAKGDSSYLPFLIDDATGKIMVLPMRAELLIPLDYQFSSGLGRSLTPELIAFMDKNKIRYKGFLGLGSYNMRFSEWLIKEDQKVYVLGTAKKTESPANEYEKELMKRLKELKKDPEKMKEIDLNKDGEISPEEWDIAVNRIERELLEEQLNNVPGEDLGDVVITKGDAEGTYILSNYSQKGLVKRLGVQACLGVFGGTILALLGLTFIAYNIFRF